MELQGKIIAVLEPKTGNSKKNEGETWMSQDYVLEHGNRKMVFNVFGEDRINRYALKVGDFVAVVFDIDAREWNGRWFNDIRTSEVVRLDQQQPQAQAQAPTPSAESGDAPFTNFNDPFAQNPELAQDWQPTGEGSMFP